jgi:hypothetical protein
MGSATTFSWNFVFGGKLAAVTSVRFAEVYWLGEFVDVVGAHSPEMRLKLVEY